MEPITNTSTATVHAAFPGSARHPAPSLPPPTPRLVLTVSEAAGLLGISRAFAYELVARGELPSIRLGRRVVVSRAQLLALVAAGGAGAPGTALTADLTAPPIH